MSELNVLLLGAPVIEVRSSPLVVDTRKAVALLAYLVVEGSPIRRDSLAGLLWPDYDTEGARGALRRTLSTLKRGLGGRWLAIDRASIAFAPDPEVFADVVVVRDALADVSRHDHGPTAPCPRCAEELRRAAGLYRGDFMTGFSLRDGIDFEEWQLHIADRYRRMLATTLERLVDFLADGHDWGQAVEHARRWVSLDPLHEPAHRRLMELHALGGDRSAAMRQYRECVAVLDKELGVPPLTETTDLYQAIKDDRLSAPTSPKPAVQEARVEHIVAPLVGREGELKSLMSALDAAASGSRVASVEGEAGIGKTRLVESFLEAATARGSRIVQARCYEEELQLAYAPVVDALQSGLTQSTEWLDRVPEEVRRAGTRLVPAIGSSEEEPDDLSGPGAQHRFLQALSILLITATEGSQPGVLFFDDVQWADEATLDVITHLVRRFASRGVLLVLAWRTEDVPAGARARRLLVQEREVVAAGIRLDRLGRAEVDQMLALDPTSGALPENVRERVFRESEGNPLFVTEYVAALAQRTSQEEEWPLPAGVRDLLKERLAEVGEEATQVCTAAAVIGRSFDFETVKEVSGRTDDEVVGALEELVARGLIAEVRGTDSPPQPTYDFGHDKIRTVAYENTGLARLRLLHRRAAGALQRGRGRDEVRSAAVARHLELGGLDEDAASAYAQAGEYARSVYANVEALAHFESALALGHPEPARIHEASGDVQTLLGEYGDALASYEAAAALARGDSPAIEHKIGAVHLRRGDYRLAESNFDAALAESLPDSVPDEFASRVLADWTMAAHGAGEHARANELAVRALELAESSSDARALSRARNVLGILATRRGDIEEAYAQLSKSLELAEKLDDSSGRVAAMNNLALAHRAAGDFEGAIKLTRRGLELCSSLGDRHREAALHNNLADLLRATGRSDEAMAHLKTAVGIFAEVGEPGEMQPEIWKLVEW